MKIDLHCHTMRTKSGEKNLNRDVTKDTFLNKLSSTGVSIVAITNHNHFNLDQYNDFSNNDKGIIIFPGVELDITGKESKGHCILITSPERAIEFDMFIKTLMGSNTPDEFNIEIDQFISQIDKKDFIIIAHYGSKTPALNDLDIDYLDSNIGNIPLLLEPSNLRSAGIMIAHNISTFIGSDVRNWDEYETLDLPTLKIPISGYQQFIKLLKKDIPTIETFINNKFAEEVTIAPHMYNDCKIKLNIYNDVNVIFGGKGTGKTELLLREIEKHFVDKGFNDVSSYYHNDDLKVFDADLLEIEIKDSDIFKITSNELISEFSTINMYKDVTITPTSDYFKWVQSRNLKKHRFGFINVDFIESIEVLSNKYEQEILHYYNTVKAILDINKYAIKPYLQDSEIQNLWLILKTLEDKSWEHVIESFSIYGSSILTKWSIVKFKNLYQKKTSVFSKPTTTGFISLFDSCLRLHIATEAISSALRLPSHIDKKIIGEIIGKGAIYQQVKYSLNPNQNVKMKFNSKAFNKTKVLALEKYIKKINDNAFNINLKKAILSYKAEKYDVTKLSDLLNCTVQIVDERDEPYSPSPGEKSMLLLNSKLMDDTKNVFILDEPEGKVGHKYINDVIIPRIIELSGRGKKIIITTHDANIAVRTLPLLSVYREQYKEGETTRYRTYIGSPFYETMKCYEDSKKSVNWVKISMDMLEGGEKAFIERGENYGTKGY